MKKYKIIYVEMGSTKERQKTLWAKSVPDAMGRLFDMGGNYLILQVGNKSFRGVK